MTLKYFLNNIDKRIKDITGKKFHRLTAIYYIKTINTHAFWNFKCNCGVTKLIDASKVRNGSIKSCGCLNSEIHSKLLREYASSEKHRGAGNPAYKRGETGNDLFKIYQGILCRCNQSKNGSHRYYYDKGIKCEWESYLDFKTDMVKQYLKHVKKFGKRQTTIDRIDGNKNYCKENCRWATTKEQGNNRKQPIKRGVISTKALAARDYLLNNLDLLNKLSVRDYKIISLRYGLNDKPLMTLISLSRLFNLTEARIGQITRIFYA